jgi:hypothetical protein
MQLKFRCTSRVHQRRWYSNFAIPNSTCDGIKCRLHCQLVSIQMWFGFFLTSTNPGFPFTSKSKLYSWNEIAEYKSRGYSSCNPRCFCWFQMSQFKIVLLAGHATMKLPSKCIHETLAVERAIHLAIPESFASFKCHNKTPIHETISRTSE